MALLGIAMGCATHHAKHQVATDTPEPPPPAIPILAAPTPSPLVPRPRLPSSNPHGVGVFSMLEITRVVREHRASIRACYLSELPLHPNLAGRVGFRITIDGAGGVAEAELFASTLQSQPAERCIRDQFLKMKFPAPGNGGLAIIHYPIDFNANAHMGAMDDWPGRNPVHEAMN